MPYTGNPSTVRADAVRVLVGDTGATSETEHLSDDAYTLVIATEGGLYAQASMAATMIAGKYAHMYTQRVGSMWREAKTLYEHFQKHAQWLRLEGQRRGKLIPFAGGVSLDAADTLAADTDVVDPAFSVGMMDAEEEE